MRNRSIPFIISLLSSASFLKASIAEKKGCVDSICVSGRYQFSRRPVKCGTAATPIIMLTAKGDEIDKVVGLEVGADDYVTKPFGRRELLARVRALLRRANPTQEDGNAQHVSGDTSQAQRPGRELLAGPLRIDLAGRRVNCRGKELELQPKQFDLLTYLARNRGTVLTRDQLLQNVWGYDYV